MRDRLLNLFYEKGYFKLARNFYFGLSMVFLVYMIIYLFKGVFGNVIFCFGGFLIFYALKKFLDSFIKSMRYKKDSSKIIKGEPKEDDMEIIDVECKEI